MAVYHAVLKTVPGQISDNEVLSFLQSNDIDWKYINTIKNLTDFNDDVIAEWLNISVRTFHTYRQAKNKFKENIKEHILLLLSLIRHGIEVFENKEAFGQWLNSGNFHLDGREPGSFLNTVTGIRFIDDRISAIEYGDNV